MTNSLIKQLCNQLNNPTGLHANLHNLHKANIVNLELLGDDSISLHLMYSVTNYDDLIDLFILIGYYPFVKLNLINTFDYTPKGKLTLQYIDSLSSNPSILEEDSFLINQNGGYSLVLGNTPKALYSSIKLLLELYARDLNANDYTVVKVSSGGVPSQLHLSESSTIKNISWISYLESLVYQLNTFTPVSIPTLLELFGIIFYPDFTIKVSHPINIFDIDSLLALLNNDLLITKESRQAFYLSATVQDKKKMIESLYLQQQAAKGVFLIPEYNTLITEKGVSAVDKLKSNPQVSQRIWTDEDYQICKVEKGQFNDYDKTYLILFTDGTSINTFSFSSFYTKEGKLLTTAELSPGDELDISTNENLVSTSGVVGKVIFNEYVKVFYKITLPQFIYPKKLVSGSGIIHGLTKQIESSTSSIKDITLQSRFLEYFYTNTVAVHNGYFFKVDLNLLHLPSPIEDYPSFNSFLETVATLSCFPLTLTHHCPNNKLLSYLHENPHVCINFINIHRYLFNKLGTPWIKWLTEGRPYHSPLITIPIHLPIDLNNIISPEEYNYYDVEKKQLRGPRGFIFNLAEKIHCRFLTYLIRQHLNYYCLSQDNIPIPTKYSNCQLNHKYLNKQYSPTTIIDLVVNLQDHLSTYLITYPLEIPGTNDILDIIKQYKDKGYVIPNFKFLG